MTGVLSESADPETEPVEVAADSGHLKGL